MTLFILLFAHDSNDETFLDASSNSKGNASELLEKQKIVFLDSTFIIIMSITV